MKKKQLYLSTGASDSRKSLRGKPVSPFNTIKQSPLNSSGLIDLMRKHQEKCAEQQDYQEAALTNKTIRELRIQNLDQQQLRLRQNFTEKISRLHELRQSQLTKIDKEEQNFHKQLLTKQQQMHNSLQQQFMRNSFSQLKQQKSKIQQSQIISINAQLKKAVAYKQYQHAIQLRNKLRNLEQVKKQLPGRIKLNSLKHRHNKLAQSIVIQKQQLQLDMKICSKRCNQFKNDLKNKIERRFKVMLQQLRECLAVQLTKLHLQSQK